MNIDISVFSGIVPRLDRRQIGPTQAQVATGCVLTSGRLQSINAPLAVSAPMTPDTVSVFRMVSGATEKWLTWDRDVDVERGPVAGDILQRIYFTGDGEPRCTDYATATSGGGPYPTACFVLGVFAPTVAPSVAYTGTVGTVTSRSLEYTFVNAWGEESAPSPVSAVVSGGNSGSGQWDLTGLQAAPANTFAVTGSSWSLGIATLVVSSTIGLRVGEEIAVSGMTPSGYNATRGKITALTSTNVSYAVASNPGAFSAGGAITRKAPHNSSTWKQRFYWTETTASGTEFRLVKEQTAATTAFVLGNATPGEECPTAEWAMPPADMICIGLLPNGIMFGASKNELCLSEVNKPYAWPTRYRQTSDFTIVAAGAVGTTIVVGTEGKPYTLTGVDPTTMGGGMVRIDQPWPCVAKRSMCSLGFGVAFAAPQGLALVGPAGAEIVTRNLFTQREWEDLTPSSIVAAVFDGRYYFSYMPVDGSSRSILTLDKTEPASLYGANYVVEELWTDPLSGVMYVVRQNVLEKWEGESGVRDRYDWKSKEFRFPVPLNMGAAKVDADFQDTASVAAAAAYAAVVAANQVLIDGAMTFGAISESQIGLLPIGGDEMSDPPPRGFESLQFNLYINDVLKFTKQVMSSKAFKLPNGYKSDTAAVRLSGNVTVRRVSVAETMTGLKRV